MKLIRIGIIIGGLSTGFFSGVAGQTTETSKSMISGQDSVVHGQDSLVHVAYGTVAKNVVRSLEGLMIVIFVP